MFTGDLTQLDPEVMFDTPNREFASKNQGRWISPDPAGVGWNQYAYTTNPNSVVDPTGLGGRYCWLNKEGTTGGCIGGQGGGGGGEDSLEAQADAYNPFEWEFTGILNGQYYDLTFANWDDYTNWLSDQALQEDFREGYWEQLGATVSALEAEGVSPDDIALFIAANPFSTNAKLAGGNFDFSNLDEDGDPIFDFGCDQERCDLGGIGTLDFSHDDNTVHLDTADPFNFPWGTLEHFGVDFILGNLWYYVIPRP